MSMLKYTQEQKEAVSDMFSKNQDPIDRFMEIKEKTKDIKMKHEYQQLKNYQKRLREHKKSISKGESNPGS